jgi:uncharacterized protein YjbJ (UPF0337 family)
VTTDTDENRIGGAAKQTKRRVKETGDKALGDATLTAEGGCDRSEGMVQKAIGGLRDTLKK